MIERLYTPLISRGLHKFKDGFNLADKDERMRKGGKGETSYILIIPVVSGWRCFEECVCVCVRGSGGGVAGVEAEERTWRASIQSSVVLSAAEFSRARPQKLPGVDVFPFNYAADLTNPEGSWVTQMHVLLFIHAHKLAMFTLR